MKFIGTIKQALEKIDPISKDSFQTHKCALNTITEQLYWRIYDTPSKMKMLSQSEVSILVWTYMCVCLSVYKLCVLKVSFWSISEYFDLLQ